MICGRCATPVAHSSFLANEVWSSVPRTPPHVTRLLTYSTHTAAVDDECNLLYSGH